LALVCILLFSFASTVYGLVFVQFNVIMSVIILI